jgi:hypothetical protein
MYCFTPGDTRALQSEALLGKIPRHPPLHPAQDLGAFTTSNGQLIEVHVLQQSEQRQSLAWTKIVFTLLEPQEDFAVRGDLLIFEKPVCLFRSFQQVTDLSANLPLEICFW